MNRSAVNKVAHLRLSWRIFAASLLVLDANAGQAFAQTPASDFARQQAERERVKRLEALRKVTPDGSVAQASEQPSGLPAAGGPCFAIDRIEIVGVKQFSAAAIAAITNPFEQSCIGLTEINTLLRGLTHLYLDKGHVAARAYVPEQDIAKTKVLRLVVAEGSLWDIYLNGNPAPWSGVLGTAFPRLRGKIVNIRDIEQGLDQINRLASNNAKTAMLPGPDGATSILNVENAPGAPWHVSFANSNLGQKQTGYSKSSVSFRMDNMVGLNDLWNFTYERTGPDHPWDGSSEGKSDSFSGGVSIPYGYWTVEANGSWYDYDSSVPGNFGDIETSGNSRYLDFGVDRVVHRDQDAIAEQAEAAKAVIADKMEWPYIPVPRPDGWLAGDVSRIGPQD